jgi:hypothetical protein
VLDGHGQRRIDREALELPEVGPSGRGEQEEGEGGEANAHPRIVGGPAVEASGMKITMKEALKG